MNSPQRARSLTCLLISYPSYPNWEGTVTYLTYLRKRDSHSKRILMHMALKSLHTPYSIHHQPFYYVLFIVYIINIFTYLPKVVSTSSSSKWCIYSIISNIGGIGKLFIPLSHLSLIVIWSGLAGKAIKRLTFLLVNRNKQNELNGYKISLVIVEHLQLQNDKFYPNQSKNSLKMYTNKQSNPLISYGLMEKPPLKHTRKQIA